MRTMSFKSIPNNAKKQVSKSENTKTGVTEGIRSLFEDQLKGIYWTEKVLIKTLPKIIKNASSEKLIEALTEHLKSTIEHVTRLEKIFSIIGIKPIAKISEAVEGLIKETAEIIAETEKGVIRDAGIISVVRKIEHYEIATYGTLVTFAKKLEVGGTTSLLEETLYEENDMDDILFAIAKSIDTEAFYESDYYYVMEEYY